MGGYNVEAATPVSGFPNGQTKCSLGIPVWLADLHNYVPATWFNSGNLIIPTT
jgi:hypothetical protein